MINHVQAKCNIILWQYGTPAFNGTCPNCHLNNWNRHSNSLMIANVIQDTPLQLAFPEQWLRWIGILRTKSIRIKLPSVYFKLLKCLSHIKIKANLIYICPKIEVLYLNRSINNIKSNRTDYCCLRLPLF